MFRLGRQTIYYSTLTRERHYLAKMFRLDQGLTLTPTATTEMGSGTCLVSLLDLWGLLFYGREKFSKEFCARCL